MKIEVPADHKQGIAVPKGGSSCASCKYLRPGLHCASEYFQRWHGSSKIPAKSADSYCSDFYEEGERRRQTAGDQLRDQRERKGH